ncbi:DUF3159 domain-containing protein [Actinoalloteichus hymeniacidonis]|uniref:DUF3159 family protein n=1 Tax=Actinoalloteichus hymeniacidonis TaxID=340345 RepID=A0AAC9HKU5_9PSEU|nr:DUF3159 domain-containing protein [Actinoalloteichus hymeniacidonis]AOS61242.1 putative DUF3159 family protein [Actinoalloteichus hymeniacidonis]MBB5910755.1 xanthosine utilization system XapX-like protein [Actinoalloteichus hymeniacidonis]
MTEHPGGRSRSAQTVEPDPDADSLPRLLGGRRGAVDASVPPLIFVLGWWLGGESVLVGAAAALLAGLVIAVLRIRGGKRPVAALLGMLGVAVAGLVAIYTGRAVDYFLVQLFSNMGSILVWAMSILVRRPLLGVIVGAVLGQKMRWRRDPGLLRAYGRASWVWVGQYSIRVAVFLPLWLAELTPALLVARTVLSLPLVTLCLAVSWAVLRRSLPTGHPGLRHPQTTSPDRPVEADAAQWTPAVRGDQTPGQPTASRAAPTSGDGG